MSKDVPALLVQYREAALGFGDRSARKANRRRDQAHALYKQLRETEEGRQAMMGLMDDPVDAVRMTAAAHSLAWAPERARAVLEALRESESPYSLEADLILIEYDKGRLSFEY